MTRSAADSPDAERSIASLWTQAAHDLRQSVQAAQLLAGMLDGTAGPAEIERTGRAIGSALTSLQEMLEALMLLARIEAGQQLVELRTCRLADALEPALQEIARTAAARGIPLRLGQLPGAVRSDPKLLALAARSLLLNAIRFGDGGGIAVDCLQSDARLRLEVAFSGRPLDAKVETHAFIQLPSHGDRLVAGELGLGFALLRRLCRPLDHELHTAVIGPDRQLLALVLPLPGAAAGER